MLNHKIFLNIYLKFMKYFYIKFNKIFSIFEKILNKIKFI